jgi:NTP pyrophosphatase (non-canonical NTP hydrolase)
LAIILRENPDGTGSVVQTYTPDEHLQQVINKSWNFAGKLETDRDHILNAVLGLAGEAGEVADLHKKMFYHADKEGRQEELLNELGDVAFYLLKVLDLNGWTLEDALEVNRAKLMKRHPKFFEEVKVG